MEEKHKEIITIYEEIISHAVFSGKDLEEFQEKTNKRSDPSGLNVPVVRVSYSS